MRKKCESHGMCSYKAQETEGWFTSDKFFFTLYIKSKLLTI